MLPFLRNMRTLYAWLLVALTDLAVVVPWILLFYRSVNAVAWAEAIPGVWLGLLVYGAASLWEAGDRHKEEVSRWRRVGAMAVGLTAAYLVAYYLLPPAMQTGLISTNAAWSFMLPAAYLWYQGTLAVAEGLNHDRLFARFPWQVGGAALGILLLIKFGGAADPKIQVLLYWSVILLLASGVIALITAREGQLRAGQASIGEKGTGSEHQSRWLSMTVLALLLLTLGASSILSVDRMGAITDTVFNFISAVYDWFASVVYLIIHRYVVLIGPWLERFFGWLLYLTRKGGQEQEGEMELGQGEEPLFEDTGAYTYADEVLQVLKAVLFFALIIGALVVIYRLSTKRKGRPAATEEEIINLGFWSNLLDDLKGLFQKGAVAAVAGAIASEMLHPRDPRMLFRRLQAWGAGLGRPRAESETPKAYGAALGTVQLENAEAVSAVTAVYNRAKYGPTPPAAADVDAAAEAMTALETVRK